MQSAELKKENREVKKGDLSCRTKGFALQIIGLFKILPQIVEAQVIGKQMLRSGTSVGAQYREAQRARSNAEFLSKLESSLQELEETGYWLELLVESGIMVQDKVAPVSQERNELTAMFVSAINTLKAKNSSL